MLRHQPLARGRSIEDEADDGGDDLLCAVRGRFLSPSASFPRLRWVWLGGGHPTSTAAQGLPPRGGHGVPRMDHLDPPRIGHRGRLGQVLASARGDPGDSGRWEAARLTHATGRTVVAVPWRQTHSHETITVPCPSTDGRRAPWLSTTRCAPRNWDDQAWHRGAVTSLS
jgi:hypothetical protein